MSSLPVPRSPITSTGRFIAAARLARSTASVETAGSRLSSLAEIQPPHWRQHLFHGDHTVPGVPRWQLTLNAYVQAQLARVGLTHAYRPLVVVMSEPGCDLQDVSFADVMIYPQQRRESPSQ